MLGLYEIWNKKFSIRFSKEKAKKMLNETVILGNKLKELIDCIFWSELFRLQK